MLCFSQILPNYYPPPNLKIEKTYTEAGKINLPTQKTESDTYCYFCNHDTGTLSNLEFHIRCHSSEKPYLCRLCPFRAAKKAILQQHLNKHNNDRKIKCPFCVFSSNNRHAMNLHIELHEGFDEV